MIASGAAYASGAAHAIDQKNPGAGVQVVSMFATTAAPEPLLERRWQLMRILDATYANGTDKGRCRSRY